MFNPYNYLGGMVQGVDPLVHGVDPMVSGLAAQLKQAQLSSMARQYRGLPALQLAQTGLRTMPVHPAASAARAADANLGAYGPMIAKLAEEAMIATRSRAGKAPATFITISTVPPATVAAGAALTIAGTVTNPCRIVDYTVSAAIAGNFVITGIIIGRIAMFQNGGGIPADRFLPNSDKAPFESPELWPGAPVNVTVQNISANPSPFFSTFDAVDLAFTP